MSDLSHHYEALDRALKRIGIILIDDHGHIRSGKSAQCVALLRKILLLTSSVLAQQMLLRGCPSHAPDKRLVISAFDLVREKIKYSPSITVEQFFKEGYAVHKISVLLKLAIFVLDTDKGMIKTPPPKVMYVVPPDDIIISIAPSSMDLDLDLGGNTTHLPAESLSNDAPCLDWTDGIDIDSIDMSRSTSKARPVSGNITAAAAAINTPAMVLQNTSSSSSSSSNGRRDSGAAAYYPPLMSAVDNKSSFKLTSNSESNSSSSSEDYDPPLVPRWMPVSRPSMLESVSPMLYNQSSSSSSSSNNRSNSSSRMVANVFDDSFEYAFPEDKDNVIAPMYVNPLSAMSTPKTRGVIPPTPNPIPTPSSSSSSAVGGGISSSRGDSSSSSHKLDFGDLFSSVVPSALRQQLYRSSSSSSNSRRSSSPAMISPHDRAPPPLDHSSSSFRTAVAAAATDPSAGSSGAPPDRGFSGSSSSSSAHRSKQHQQQLNAADLEPVLQYIDEAIRKGITNNEFLTKALEEHISILVENRVEAALTDMSTKYDFIINKIVTSVDAEFSSVHRKIGAISSQLK